PSLRALCVSAVNPLRIKPVELFGSAFAFETHLDTVSHAEYNEKIILFPTAEIESFAHGRETPTASIPFGTIPASGSIQMMNQPMF
ncbi:MAG TPA: hypothetical protein VFI91_08600, partial [Longimicrobiaceae bacterium]|nr:hypothetical protein [Longimicrobiaceae bacterium]